MTTQRKPSEILRAIGERIREPSRWTTAADARDLNGTNVDPLEANAVCWCWYGALCIEARRSASGRDGAIRYMRLAADVRAIDEFNDTHTHAEVLAANARAIELAEENGE